MAVQAQPTPGVATGAASIMVSPWIVTPWFAEPGADRRSTLSPSSAIAPRC